MKPIAPNTMIQDRYLVVHLIGKGGMGEVYLAVDQRLGSAVALKRTSFSDDENLANAFEREAKILARLRHPVLPKVSDHFIENGDQYLVMEHISGDDLTKRLETSNKPFPANWVMFWADQLLDALTYLHSHEPPIIHRDIKPQNLKLTDENSIVLLDFGLSKDTSTMTYSRPGQSGSVVGYTPHFAPMEQIRGTGTNPKSDLYSLSATLYQLMTNRVPADALTRADAMLNDKGDPIVSVSAANPEISQDVSEVIMRGLEVSQERRFSSASEMQKALRSAYAKMKEAMSASTVVFNAEEAELAGLDPVSRHKPESDITSKPPETPHNFLKPSDDPSPQDFAATVKMDEPPRAAAINSQADAENEIETRVIQKAPQSVPVIEQSSVPAVEDIPVPQRPQPPQTKAAAAAAGKKGGGKFVGTIIGLVALLAILGAAALGGLYWYSQRQKTVIANTATTTPTPMPTPDLPPTPVPMTASETNTGSNSNAANMPVSNTETNPVANSGVSTASTSSAQPPPQQSSKPQQNDTRAEKPAKPSRPSSGTKPPPVKPRSGSDRTDILQ